MQIISTGTETETFDGLRFRIHVLDESPCCNVKHANAIEWIGDETKCGVCCATIELPENAPTVITVFAERKVHNAECVRCATAGQTGRGCEMGTEFFSRIMSHVGKRETPWIVSRTRTFSTGYTETRRTGHWTEKEARAWASVQGGDVIDQTDKFIVIGY